MPRAKPLPIDAPLEPIWWLRSLPYSDYRQTNWWRHRRDTFLSTYLANHGEKRCELCGITHINTTRNAADIFQSDETRMEITFHVHHRTYDRLGYEPDADLALLCAPCHNLVHRPDSHAAQHWLEINLTSEPPSDLAPGAALLDPERDNVPSA